MRVVCPERRVCLENLFGHEEARKATKNERYAFCEFLYYYLSKPSLFCTVSLCNEPGRSRRGAGLLRPFEGATLLASRAPPTFVCGAAPGILVPFYGAKGFVD